MFNVEWTNLIHSCRLISGLDHNCHWILHFSELSAAQLRSRPKCGFWDKMNHIQSTANVSCEHTDFCLHNATSTFPSPWPLTPSTVGVLLNLWSRFSEDAGHTEQCGGEGGVLMHKKSLCWWEALAGYHPICLGIHTL